MSADLWTVYADGQIYLHWVGSCDRVLTWVVMGLSLKACLKIHSASWSSSGSSEPSSVAVTGTARSCIRSGTSV